MKLGFCVACAATDDLHHHHLVPRSAGGSDDAANLITLCAGCHFTLHEHRSGGGYNHRRLTIAGLQAAKARGVQLGRQETADANKAAAAARDAELEPVLRELSDLSLRKISAELESRGLGRVPFKTVERMLVRLGLRG